MHRFRQRLRHRIWRAILLLRGYKSCPRSPVLPINRYLGETVSLLELTRIFYRWRSVNNFTGAFIFRVGEHRLSMNIRFSKADLGPARNDRTSSVSDDRGERYRNGGEAVYDRVKRIERRALLLTFHRW